MTSVVARGGKPGKEGRVVSAEGRKTAFPPLQNHPSSPRSRSLCPVQPAIRCINILFFICVHIHDTPVKGLEKTTGMKVFQMLCLLDRKKGFIRVAQAI